MRKEFDFKDLVTQFKFEGELLDCNYSTSGNINDTYIIDSVLEDGSINKYILQRINTVVFNNAHELMENIKHVTSHIADKVKKLGGNPLRETLNVIETVDGQSYHKTSSGDCWRALVFIDGARTYEKVEEPIHMYTTGKALGKFQKYLSDFPVDLLHETIPDFHNTAKRYEEFLQVLKKDPVGRAKDISAEIDFLMTRGEETSILVDMIESGKLPLRVTHNDTKFNNIMIDNETNEGIAVIDLDTVMPGLSLYDFGDAVRSGASTAEEDETDLSKVNFDLNLFENFTKGYLEEVRDSLTEIEIEYLPFSAKIISLELGMRFLMDYINGDIYFKVNSPNHNLDRARNQFKLVSDIEDNMDKLKEIVKKYA